MMRLCNVTTRAAVVTAVVVAAGLSSAQAQALRGKLGASTPPAAAAPAAAAPAPAAPQAMSEAVAATVNDDIISTYDLAQRMRLLIATSGIQPTKDNLAQFQHESLVSLVDERLQLQELRRVEKQQKITILATDPEVMEEINGLAQQNNMTGEQFLAALKQQGIGRQTLFEQIRAQVSWQRWIRGRYGSRLRVGDDQVKAMQARLTAAAAKPQYEISEVFIDANRVGGMAAAMDGARQLVAQLQQGAPFPAVARQFSASSTAAAGGDAGWVSQGEMAPEVNAALDQLRPGQLSQPIAVKDGVYIIYLRDKRSGVGELMVNLKQVAVPLTGDASEAQVADATAKLTAVRGQIKGCDSLEAAASKTSGVVAGDLGEASLADLAPQFKDAAQGLDVGQVSQPIRTNAGLHLIAVCGKRAGGDAQMDRDQIEGRLFGQQLSMISRRYMRDLRNSATIESK